MENYSILNQETKEQLAKTVANNMREILAKNEMHMHSPLSSLKEYLMFEDYEQMMKLACKFLTMGAGLPSESLINLIVYCWSH